jgi:hypothetical protein
MNLDWPDDEQRTCRMQSIKVRKNPRTLESEQEKSLHCEQSGMREKRFVVHWCTPVVQRNNQNPAIVTRQLELRRTEQTSLAHRRSNKKVPSFSGLWLSSFAVFVAKF